METAHGRISQTTCKEIKEISCLIALIWMKLGFSLGPMFDNIILQMMLTKSKIRPKLLNFK